MLIGNETVAEANPGNDRACYSSAEQCNFGTQLAVISFVVEIPSAVMDQMASDHKPVYVLAIMLLSLATLLFCLVELACIGIKEKITWRWNNGGIPWFYHPPPSNKPFGKLIEIIGLACSMAQSVISAINCYFCLKDHTTPVKISVWPVKGGVLPMEMVAMLPLPLINRFWSHQLQLICNNRGRAAAICKFCNLLQKTLTYQSEDIQI
ncbi:hypothetical protein PTKIN_Ptkin02bG0245200 [Pterospermum kingtungense]